MRAAIRSNALRVPCCQQLEMAQLIVKNCSHISRDESRTRLTHLQRRASNTAQTFPETSLQHRSPVAKTLPETSLNHGSHISREKTRTRLTNRKRLTHFHGQVWNTARILTDPDGPGRTWANLGGFVQTQTRLNGPGQTWAHLDGPGRTWRDALNRLRPTNAVRGGMM